MALDFLPSYLAARKRPTTGRLPTPPEVLARHRLTLARAGMSGPTGLVGTTLNSGNAIAAYGTGLGRALGNKNFSNCISAALGWHELIVTTATGATPLFLPEGGNPPTSDTWFGTGLSSQVPANSPGVIAWSQANNCLGNSTIAAVLSSMATSGAWPHGGFVDLAGGHHPIGLYGSIVTNNQAEIQTALANFKTVIFGLQGDALLPAASGSQRFFSGLAAGHNDDHCFCCCDCGPASSFVTPYGITLPNGYDPTTFCIGGITWGYFVVIDWASLQNVVSEGWVIITDPNRSDAATWNGRGAAYYRAMVGTNGPFLASALLSYGR